MACARTIALGLLATLALVLLAAMVVAPEPGRAEPQEGEPVAAGVPTNRSAPSTTLPTATPPVAKWALVGTKPELVLAAFAPLRGSLDPRIRSGYEWAAALAIERWPECGVRWTILAAIGSIESAHGAHNADAVVLTESGLVLPKILGPLLDGSGGHARIVDSDGGEIDGDATVDRAVGPMQFLPSTWKRHGQDANGDGVADPHSIDDAALTAAKYLCAAARGDLREIEVLERALFSYNHDLAYVATVRVRIDRFDLEFGLLPPPESAPPVEEPPETSAPPSAPPVSVPTTAPATTTPPSTHPTTTVPVADPEATTTTLSDAP